MPGEVLAGCGRGILTAEEAAAVEAPPVALHLFSMVDGAAAGAAFVAASPVWHGGGPVCPARHEGRRGEVC